MTQHYLLPTADRAGLAWITETSAFFGLGNSSQVEKVLYLENHKLACSAWGDFVAVNTMDAFAEQVRRGTVTISDPGSITTALKQIGEEMLPEHERTVRPANQQSRGVLVAALERPVCLYQAFITWKPIALSAVGSVIAGDAHNFANLFPKHYYDLSGQSIGECVLIGLHAMRIARRLNSFTIGDPNVWVFHEGVFRRLSSQELGLYTEQSDALDAAILKAFREGGSRK